MKEGLFDLTQGAARSGNERVKRGGRAGVHSCSFSFGEVN
jgi:hypothetical protein